MFFIKKILNLNFIDISKYIYILVLVTLIYIILIIKKNINESQTCWLANHFNTIKNENCSRRNQ